MKNEEKIVPELCFPEFDEEWVSARLGDVFSFKVTNSFSRDNLNYKSGLVKNIHYGDIHTKFQTLFDITKETLPFVNEEIDIYKIKEDNYCQEGDLIFADASEDLTDVGKSIEIVNLNNEKLISGLHTILARPNFKFCNAGFLGFLFKSDLVRKQIQRESQGTKVLSISTGRLSNLIIHYPLSIIHSTKIASCLSSLDDLITAESQQLEALKAHKKGLMQQLFPAEGETVPRLRFGEFGGEWEVKMLSSIYTFIVTNSFSRDQLNYNSGLVKNIHYGDIHTKFSTLFDITKEFVPLINPEINLDKIKTESYCIEGDIIFADASEDLEDVGKSLEIVFLNNEKLVSGMHTMMARQKEKNLVTGFGGHLFKSDKIRLQIQKEAQGTKVLGISVGRLSNIKIPFPKNKKEQQKIADCLSSLDEWILAQGEKIAGLKAHKKGLMQGLFPTIITN